MELIKTFVKDSIQLNVYGTFENPLFMAKEIGSISVTTHFWNNLASGLFDLIIR